MKPNGAIRIGRKRMRGFDGRLRSGLPSSCRSHGNSIAFLPAGYRSSPPDQHMIQPLVVRGQ